MCSNKLSLSDITDDTDGESDDNDVAYDDIQVSVELEHALAPRQFCIAVSVATRCRHKRAPVLHIQCMHQ